jgi:hypothetical protein
VAGIPGTGGRLHVESPARFTRNGWPASAEYASTTPAIEVSARPQQIGNGSIPKHEWATAWGRLQTPCIATAGGSPDSAATRMLGMHTRPASFRRNRPGPEIPRLEGCPIPVHRPAGTRSRSQAEPVGVESVDDWNPVARRERAPGAGDDVPGREVPAPKRFHAGACRPEAAKVAAVPDDPVPRAADQTLVGSVRHGTPPSASSSACPPHGSSDNRSGCGVTGS